MHKHLRPLHRPIAWAAFTALLGLSSLALVKCTRVGDHLTGVTLDRRGPAETCIKECNDLYAKFYDDERVRHLAAVRECQEKPSGGQKNACLTTEAIFHEANKRDLARAKQQCHDKCHRQGGGRIQ